MSSIKERAAALNLAEKLCARPPVMVFVSVGPGGATRPVQSSSIWSSIVSHLRSTVTVKRRTVHLKSHNDCFLGSDAVDVVTEHIANAVDLEGDVSRDKVACVCQALLRCNVFEAVGTKVFGKNRKRDVFQDGKSSSARPRRRLTSWKEASLSSGSRSSSAALLQTDFICRLQISSPHSSFPSVVNEVWQEQTLFRLLNLVELPLLEGVLQCTSSPPAETPVAPGNPDLIYSSNHLDRHILKAFRSSQEDEWLCAALDCLDFLPDQPVVELSRELPHGFPPEEDSVQCKLLLYETLVKHYSCSRPPLLPQPMTDIYMAITDLLVSGSLDRALEALQLCLKLLPQSSREELRTLLSFMSLAADPRGIKLDKEMENRLAVKRSFSRAILHSKTLSKEKEDLLLVFMLSNVKQIFKIPGSLHKAVSEKLARLAGGEQPDVAGKQTNKKQQETLMAKTTTNQELWVLLNNINLDPKISTKERKRLLRHFSHAHPEIFNQYFGDSAAAEL
uniref:DEP domain-containing protein 7 n=1 Tax=Kryptolebias marmoratus TaxID=37003 RepID=A0A3Q3A204_KRYMA